MHVKLASKSWLVNRYLESRYVLSLYSWASGGLGFIHLDSPLSLKALGYSERRLMRLSRWSLAVLCGELDVLIENLREEFSARTLTAGGVH